MLKTVLTYKFDQLPDYEYIIGQIKIVMDKESKINGWPQFHKFEWMVKYKYIC